MAFFFLSQSTPDLHNKLAEPVEMSLEDARKMAAKIESQQDTEKPMAFPLHVILKKDPRNKAFLFVENIDFGKNVVVEFHGDEWECINVTAKELRHIQDNNYTTRGNLKVFSSNVACITTDVTKVSVCDTTAKKIDAIFANCVVLRNMPYMTSLKCFDEDLQDLYVTGCSNFKPTAIQKMLLEEQEEVEEWSLSTGVSMAYAVPGPKL